MSQIVRITGKVSCPHAVCLNSLYRFCSEQLSPPSKCSASYTWLERRNTCVFRFNFLFFFARSWICRHVFWNPPSRVWLQTARRFVCTCRIDLWLSSEVVEWPDWKWGIFLHSSQNGYVLLAVWLFINIVVCPLKSQQRQPLLGNGSVNTPYARWWPQQTCTQQ
jgi:hypothetical protein